MIRTSSKNFSNNSCKFQLCVTNAFVVQSVCDLNGRRNSAIVTALTMVETKPFTRFVCATLAFSNLVTFNTEQPFAIFYYRDAADNFARLSHDDTDTTIVGDLSSE